MREESLRCAVCGQSYRADAWRRLPRIRTLSGTDVHPYVVAWPEGRVVEVRACRTCGQSMARTADATPLHLPTETEPGARCMRIGRDPTPCH
jgi:hypothetical protein